MQKYFQQTKDSMTVYRQSYHSKDMSALNLNAVFDRGIFSSCGKGQEHL
jgi:hypothetical protein